MFIRGWNVLIKKKCWNVLGYLGVENNENDSGVTCFGYLTLGVGVSREWSFYGVKRLTTILDMHVIVYTCTSKNIHQCI